MDEDDSVLGLALNIVVGAIVISIEIGAWIVWVSLVAIVGLLELFFDVLGLGDD